MNYDDERANRTFNMFLFLIAIAFLIGMIAGVVLSMIIEIPNYYG